MCQGTVPNSRWSSWAAWPICWACADAGQAPKRSPKREVRGSLPEEVVPRRAGGGTRSSAAELALHDPQLVGQLVVRHLRRALDLLGVGHAEDHGHLDVTRADEYLGDLEAVQVASVSSDAEGHRTFADVRRLDRANSHRGLAEAGHRHRYRG